MALKTSNSKGEKDTRNSDAELEHRNINNGPIRRALRLLRFLWSSLWRSAPLDYSPGVAPTKYITAKSLEAINQHRSRDSAFSLDESGHLRVPGYLLPIIWSMCRNPERLCGDIAVTLYSSKLGDAAPKNTLTSVDKSSEWVSFYAGTTLIQAPWSDVRELVLTVDGAIKIHLAMIPHFALLMEFAKGEALISDQHPGIEAKVGQVESELERRSLRWLADLHDLQQQISHLAKFQKSQHSNIDLDEVRRKLSVIEDTHLISSREHFAKLDRSLEARISREEFDAKITSIEARLRKIEAVIFPITKPNVGPDEKRPGARPSEFPRTITDWASRIRNSDVHHRSDRNHEVVEIDLEMESPLAILGYRVGRQTLDRTHSQYWSKRHRQEFLEDFLSTPFPSCLRSKELEQWGAPRSRKRAEKTLGHLSFLIEYNGMKPNLDVAVQHWEEDIAYIRSFPTAKQK